ncbi:EpsG family protein [Flavobacterium ajazii]|uniref:EpsG family protein n=1 Tax=Flavobacterium ajazii TaxID=2692318 RepID=UPI0013D0170D|nr:EpsG family protein [Flavobacterium ajazii]
MFFYILLILLILALFFVSYFKPDVEKKISIILLLIMILIGGFRDRIGPDYQSYVNWYLYKTRDDGLEFGFVAIMNLFRWINLSPAFLFFFFSFLTYCFLFLGVRKYTGNSAIAILFYMLIPSLYLSSFSMIRQSFSVAISFYAFYYLINKKYLIYLLLMFIGISIHNSCLIAFFVFFFVFKYGYKVRVNHLYGLLIISFLLSRLDFFQIFRALFEKTRYIHYFSNEAIPTDFLKIIIMNLQGILILFYFQQLKNKYSYQQYLIVLYCFSIVFVNFFSKSNDLIRFSNYFRIFEIIIIGDLIFLEKNRKRLLFFVCFYGLYLGAFFNALKKDFDLPSSNTPKFVPYKSILWPSEKY